MKKRIQIDSSILAFLIIFTAFLSQFTYLYPKNKAIDDIFDCFGIVIILLGVLIRMSARGHKKANSKKSESLVITGPYILTRNPMYLGSFMLGAGFILIVWPWWSLFIFSWLFYMRFNKQMVKEEKFLDEKFGAEYKEFCNNTPRIFLSLKKIKEYGLRKVFNLDEALSTKEKRGLIGWPLLAIILETIQEKMVFGYTNIGRTILLFVLVELMFFFVLYIFYKEQNADEQDTTHGQDSIK